LQVQIKCISLVLLFVDGGDSATAAGGRRRLWNAFASSASCATHVPYLICLKAPGNETLWCCFKH
jgi:hypothetical protein